MNTDRVALSWIIAVGLVTLSCAGRTAGLQQDYGSITPPEQVVTELESSATPPSGVDSALWAALTAELERQLAALPTRMAALAPFSPRSRTTLSLTGLSTLGWGYHSQGDYDQNGEVNVSDLVPLSLHFGEAAPFGGFQPDSIQAVVDGDGNGEINLADIQPIATNFRCTVSEYRLYRSPDAAEYPGTNSDADNGDGELWQVIQHASASGTPTQERLRFSLEPAEPRSGDWLWLRPSDGSDEGIASNAAGPLALDLIAPQNVAASDGLHLDRVVVSWDAVPGAGSYLVFRDEQINEIATVTAPGWDDTGVPDSNSHSYWVQARRGDELGPLSEPDTGYRATLPEIISVGPLAGSEGQIVTFSAVTLGSQPLNFSWDFDGGASPGSSSQSSPQVTLGASGNYEVELEVSNPFGSDVLGFALSVFKDEIVAAPDALLAVPHKNQAAVGEEIFVQVITGAPAWPFLFMTGVRIQVEGQAHYVPGTFDTGIPDANPNAALPIDGLWAAIEPDQFLLAQDTFYSFSPVDGGNYTIDFNISPIGGNEINGIGGTLFSFKLYFVEPGTYNLSFVEFDGVNRTYYSGFTATDRFWGDISNVDPQFSRTITVTAP